MARSAGQLTWGATKPVPTVFRGEADVKKDQCKPTGLRKLAFPHCVLRSDEWPFAEGAGLQPALFGVDSCEIPPQTLPYFQTPQTLPLPLPYLHRVLATVHC